MYPVAKSRLLPHFFSDELSDLDINCTQNYGISSEVLMESAGLQSALFIQQLFLNQSVTIFCGNGHNAGDGFVCARHLFQLGFSVSVVVCRAVETFKPLTLIQYERCVKMGVSLYDLSDFDVAVCDSDVVVDALLGIGIASGLREPLVRLVSDLNALSAKRLSLDIPTGVFDDFDSETCDFFQSDYVLSFAYLSQIFLTYPGLFGSVYLAYIGLYSEYASLFKKSAFLEVAYSSNP